jgi:hypothetical protein
MDTVQQIVTQVAHGDFAAVEQRLADCIKPFIFTSPYSVLAIFLADGVPAGR